MVNLAQDFTRFETQIRHVIETLRGEKNNPPELQMATNRLLMDAERLDDYLSLHDLSNFKRLLAEMKEEALKARTFAKIRPDLPQKTQKNLEYVQYSIEALCRQSGLMN